MIEFSPKEVFPTAAILWPPIVGAFPPLLILHPEISGLLGFYGKLREGRVTASF